MCQCNVFDVMIAFGCGGALGSVIAAYVLSRVILPMPPTEKPPFTDPDADW